jgi:hypothetical protein
MHQVLLPKRAECQLMTIISSYGKLSPRSLIALSLASVTIEKSRLNSMLVARNPNGRLHFAALIRNLRKLALGWLRQLRRAGISSSIIELKTIYFCGCGEGSMQHGIDEAGR